MPISRVAIDLLPGALRNEIPQWVKRQQTKIGDLLLPLTPISRHLTLAFSIPEQFKRRSADNRVTSMPVGRMPMPRIALDLNAAADRQKVKGQWRVAPGLVPGEPNEGLTAQLKASPARLAEYDDSSWEVWPNVRESRSVGFTFAWYRVTVEIPPSINGVDVAGSRVWFETNIDNYGEIWINGQIDRSTGVIVGINASQRVEVSSSAVPGNKYVIAVLVLNGPLAEPRGGIFMRYAILAFESPN
jgi:hypothetical protein